MSVVLYSQPACFKCRATARYLDKLNLPYQEVDVSKDPEAKEYIQGLGYLTTPVVTVGDKHWSDFRIELISQIPELLLQSA